VRILAIDPGLARVGERVVEFTPMQIKQALTGHGHADKDDMLAAVMRELNLDSPPRPDDAAEALAAALTGWCQGGSAKSPPLYTAPHPAVPRFDPLDPGFRARREAVDALFKPWTLIGASGSHLEAQLMTRAAITAQLDRMLGSCVTPAEVMDLVESRKERCLLMLVDSIAPDHGEALINQLRVLPRPPAVVLLLESTAWLQVNAYPLDRVDAVVKTQSFGSGVLIEALTAVNRGHRYVDPALLCALKANSRGNQPQLTPREQQTLEELAQGLTNREIAQRLGIAETTTREYTRSVLQKLNARNRTMAVGAAMKLGLLLQHSRQDGAGR